MKNQVFRMKNLVFRSNLGFLSKNPVFEIKNFEILCFLHNELEILGISIEIRSTSKKL